MYLYKQKTLIEDLISKTQFKIEYPKGPKYVCDNTLSHKRGPFIISLKPTSFQKPLAWLVLRHKNDKRPYL